MKIYSWFHTASMYPVDHLHRDIEYVPTMECRFREGETLVQAADRICEKYQGEEYIRWQNEHFVGGNPFSDINHYRDYARTPQDRYFQARRNLGEILASRGIVFSGGQVFDWEDNVNWNEHEAMMPGFITSWGHTPNISGDDDQFQVSKKLTHLSAACRERWIALNAKAFAEGNGGSSDFVSYTNDHSILAYGKTIKPYYPSITEAIAEMHAQALRVDERFPLVWIHPLTPDEDTREIMRHAVGLGADLFHFNSVWKDMDLQAAHDTNFIANLKAVIDEGVVPGEYPFGTDIPF